MTWFESFANSERYKTLPSLADRIFCLRALLIQKDTKLGKSVGSIKAGLRALLIQKDTKHRKKVENTIPCLRALLIQKDTKLRKCRAK